MRCREDRNGLKLLGLRLCNHDEGCVGQKMPEPRFFVEHGPSTTSIQHIQAEPVLSDEATAAAIEQEVPMQLSLEFFAFWRMNLPY